MVSAHSGLLDGRHQGKKDRLRLLEKAARRAKDTIIAEK